MTCWRSIPPVKVGVWLTEGYHHSNSLLKEIIAHEKHEGQKSGKSLDGDATFYRVTVISQ